MKYFMNPGRPMSERTITKIYNNAKLGKDTIMRGYIYRLVKEEADWRGDGYYGTDEVIYKCKQGDENREFLDCEGHITTCWQKVYEKRV